MSAAWPDSDPAAGWNITRNGERWRAVWHRALTPRQLQYGCRAELVADSAGELGLYITGETIKRDMVDISGRLVDRMRQAEQWAAEQDQPQDNPEHGPQYPYEVIAEWIVGEIKARELIADMPIPSEASIGKQFPKAARTTIRRAVAHLREQGVVYTIPGRGSFVAAPAGHEQAAAPLR